MRDVVDRIVLRVWLSLAVKEIGDDEGGIGHGW